MKQDDNIAMLAQKAADKKSLFGKDVDFSIYKDSVQPHAAVETLDVLENQKKALEEVGITMSEVERAGTYLQLDHSIVHCNTNANGVEMMSIDEALKKYDGLKEYWWKAIAPDSDKFTARAALHQEHGYFIRVPKGVKVEYPVQACMYISNDDVIQDIHNIIIVEEDAELNVITGCATDPKVSKGMHIGVSEYYVKKGGKLSFTMIHRWGEEVVVRPRSAVVVEENGQYLSNFICMHKVKDLQMYPTTYLVGKGAVARLNSILVAPEGAYMDIGGRAVLEVPNTKAEIVTRTLSTGGTVINRGHLLGKAKNIKAHLECHGLLLNQSGVIHAIPELEARKDEAQMSHEAAVGKIAQEEIEYLMARGLDEEEAAATIVRGFLNVNIEGLPKSLAIEIEKAVHEFSLKKGC